MKTVTLIESTSKLIEREMPYRVILIDHRANTNVPRIGAAHSQVQGVLNEIKRLGALPFYE